MPVPRACPEPLCPLSFPTASTRLITSKNTASSSYRPSRLATQPCSPRYTSRPHRLFCRRVPGPQAARPIRNRHSCPRLKLRLRMGLAKHLHPLTGLLFRGNPRVRGDHRNKYRLWRQAVNNRLRHPPQTQPLRSHHRIVFTCLGVRSPRPRYLYIQAAIIHPAPGVKDTPERSRNERAIPTRNSHQSKRRNREQRTD